MLLRRWTSKRDPAKAAEISAFLETAEARTMSDRAIARRLLVHHQLVARLRAEVQPKLPPRESSNRSPSHPIQPVDDSSQRAPLEAANVGFEGPEAGETGFGDPSPFDRQWAAAATEAWIRSFDPVPEVPVRPVSSFADTELDELPAFLERRRTPETDAAIRRHVEEDRRRPLVGGIAGLFAAHDRNVSRRGWL
jgi:hypothetical protein